MEPDWLSQRAREAEAAVPGGFDLSECVREPIHLLGGVQSYGTLLAVAAVSGIVDTAAENSGALLGVAAGDLVGANVLEVLDADDWAEVLDATTGEDGTGAALPVVAGAGPKRRSFDVSAHRREGLVIMEFEPREDSAAFHFSGFYQGIRRALARLRSAGSVEDCCRVAVRQVRELTGYDRVVAYRFDGADGPGEVVAEDVTEGWEPWLGLWFPATDIPPQARRLYEENWIRVIADVDDPTVRLYPRVRAATGTPLDLSGSALRTVSEFHLEYLRNIGVRSSMSVSVLREGRLWGLIACHGGDPVRLAPEVRSACELFGAAFSLQLAAIEERSRADALTRSGGRAAAVAELLGADLETSLVRHAEQVQELMEADAVLLMRGGRLTCAGPSVRRDVADELGLRAAELLSGEVWDTDRLPEMLAKGTAPETTRVPGMTGEPGTSPGSHAAHESAAEGPGTAEESGSAGGTGDPDWSGGIPAGALLIPLRPGDYLAWLRGERPLPRKWAADPSVPVRVGPRGERLTPRGSSEVFRSVTRGRSRPWTPQDRAAAGELWRMLTGLVLHHADVLGELNEELRMTNTDLDSFAHAAAHDLKEPLRGISNAATFTLEDAGDSLDDRSVARLRTMERLAGRMDELLNSLLYYARLGRAGLRRRELPLDEAVDGALEVAGPRLAEERVMVLRPPSLPYVNADPDRLDEILVNLLVNAAKYAADRPDRTVTIDVENVDGPNGAGTEQAVVVRDNGLGIPADRQAEVFDLFRRLHGPGDHGGGSGVGLAVVKRIVERHGGRLWLESEPGVGSAFYFTLGEPAPPSEPA
ncbi:ATP-binding protein [Streptomyces sp. NPDC086783]|uniref:ATP-binding protein n=1 Tax=Streptomyces sp. NPDC086783 TaxID=3365758 RepID=UPI0038301593